MQNPGSCLVNQVLPVHHSFLSSANGHVKGHLCVLFQSLIASASQGPNCSYVKRLKPLSAWKTGAAQPGSQKDLTVFHSLEGCQMSPYGHKVASHFCGATGQSALLLQRNDLQLYDLMVTFACFCGCWCLFKFCLWPQKHQLPCAEEKRSKQNIAPHHFSIVMVTHCLILCKLLLGYCWLRERVQTNR